MKDKVSVIIPVFNGEKFIKDSINSVLNQTYKNIEIVIVNDASTDNTEKIIFENFKSLIKDKKLMYFKNKENKERVFSRNFGVKKSTGNYIFFLDYDDIWEKDYIENSLQYLNEFDIVYSFPRTIIDSKGYIKKISKKSLQSLEYIIFTGNIGYPSATAIKKNKFIGFKEKFLMREDWEFFLRAYTLNLKIYLLDNNKVYIREHSSRTSKDKSFFNATLNVYYAYKDKIPVKYLPYFYTHISDVAFRFGDFKIGYNFFFKALRLNPKILKEKRILLNFLKRGFRVDRFL